MELIEVEAVEDRTRAQGGHAVIVLRGVAALPDVVRFRLRPIDLEGVANEARQFFEKEHEPLSVHETEDGIALTIGPEIADNPALVSGTAVDITLAAAGLRGEFLWPAITPLARPKRRNIMARRTSSDPLPRPLMAASALEPGASAGAPVQPPLGARDSPSPAPEEASVVIAARSLPGAVSQAPSQPVVRAAPVAAHDSTPDVIAPAPTGSAFGEPVLVPPGVAEAPRLAPASHAESAAPPPSQMKDAPAVRRKAWEISAAGAAIMTAAILLLGQIVALRTLDLSIMKRGSTAPVAQIVTLPVARASLQNNPPRAEVAPQIGFYSVIASGPRSPRGVTSADVSPARALQLAHTLMHGPEAVRDSEEAIYWLKRYLMSTAGTEHARIALTQLGSAYAQPSRADRNLAHATMAWELAAALGDSVAMCFLGALHEHGLGTAVAIDEAQVWYQRAEAAGGRCVSAAATPAAGER